jgi:hypothetical protein
VATPVQKNDRLTPPLIYAFRAAHRKRDAVSGGTCFNT